jgi:hypothetical protein
MPKQIIEQTNITPLSEIVLTDAAWLQIPTLATKADFIKAPHQEALLWSGTEAMVRSLRSNKT